MDCRFVLLAGARGSCLTAEATQLGADFLVTPDGRNVVKPLLKAGKGCVLSVWISQIRSCPRLLPLEDKVYIVTNETFTTPIKAWAATYGFPPDNVISNGCTASCERPGDACDLATALRAMPASAWVFAASTDYCLEPGFNLLRLVEAGIVTGRPTIAMCSACTSVTSPAGAVLFPDAEDSPMEGISGYMAKIVARAGDAFRISNSALQPLLEGAELAQSTTFRTLPLLGLPHTSQDALLQFVTAGHTPWRALETFIVQHNCSAVLTGYRVSAVFTIRSVSHLLLTDNFFSHLEKQRMHAAIAAARLEAGPSAPHRCGVMSTHLRDDGRAPVALARLEVAPDVAHELQQFDFDERNALITRSCVEGANMLLPKRFNQPGTWNYNSKRKQHACYATESAVVGAQPPQKPDMPLVWHGAHGEFTSKLLLAGMSPSKALKCWTEMSKVHKALDEYTHYR